ncbi:hypothetical protein [Phenylobacterium sp.]|jgi:hypothetical protein|uniref:hypothetical protein n=1 Tax=Phenylobacterium sp. TaxID=1871053 RepID=UPI002F3EDD8D
MPQYKLVVMSNPMEGREDEYNKWYNEHHLGAVLDIDDYTAAQRFRIVDGFESSHRYMALYDAESVDTETAMAKISQRVAEGRMPISDALDLRTSVTFYEPITPLIKAKGG